MCSLIKKKELVLLFKKDLIGSLNSRVFFPNIDPASAQTPARSVVDASMSDEQSPTAYTSPLYISPEIEEKPDLPSLPAKVVSWDVAEEKEMANLKGEISKHKENVAVLENKATQLQKQCGQISSLLTSGRRHLLFST